MKIDLSILNPVMPREHGVFVIAIIPLLTALCISFPFFVQPITPVLLFCGSVIFFLMAFSPIITSIRKGRWKFLSDRHTTWAAIYCLVSGALFGWMLALCKLWGLLLFLLPVGAIFFYYYRLLRTGENKDNLLMNILGMLALCLVAPMAYYISTQRMDSNALMIYLMNAGFFSCRIIFVMQMINLKENDAVLANFKTRRKYFRNVSLLNVVIIHVLVFLSILKMIPPGAVTSLLPGSIYTWKQIISLKKKPLVRNVGLKEMGVAIFFSAVLIYSYSIGWPPE